MVFRMVPEFVADRRCGCMVRLLTQLETVGEVDALVAEVGYPCLRNP